MISPTKNSFTESIGSQFWNEPVNKRQKTGVKINDEIEKQLNERTKVVDNTNDDDTWIQKIAEINVTKTSRKQDFCEKFKRIKTFDLTETHFQINQKSSNKQICRDLVANDYCNIKRFKTNFIYFVPIVGLFFLIWFANRMFRNFKLGVSRKLFYHNGLDKVIVIGSLLVTLFVSTLAVFMICVYGLKLFVNFGSINTTLEYIYICLGIIFGYLIIIHYFLVLSWLYWVKPKVQRNYLSLIKTINKKVDWLQPASIVNHFNDQNT